MRVLRARPHPDPAVPIIRDGAGRSDRGVHLVGPDVGPRHRLRRAGDCRIDIALVEQRPWRRRIGAQRGLQVLQVGQRRRRLPAHFQLRRRLDRVLLALGNDADEIADADDGDEPRNIAHRSFIDRDQAGADEGAGVDAGIKRAHHAAVQHAGHADIVDVDEFAGRLGRKVDARHRLADDAVSAHRLDRRRHRRVQAGLFRRRSIRHS